MDKAMGNVPFSPHDFDGVIHGASNSLSDGMNSSRNGANINAWYISIFDHVARMQGCNSRTMRSKNMQTLSAQCAGYSRFINA